MTLYEGFTYESWYRLEGIPIVLHDLIQFEYDDGAGNLFKMYTTSTHQFDYIDLGTETFQCTKVATLPFVWYHSHMAYDPDSR